MYLPLSNWGHTSLIALTIGPPLDQIIEEKRETSAVLTDGDVETGSWGTGRRAERLGLPGRIVYLNHKLVIRIQSIQLPTTSFILNIVTVNMFQ